MLCQLRAGYPHYPARRASSPLPQNQEREHDKMLACANPTIQIVQKDPQFFLGWDAAVVAILTWELQRVKGLVGDGGADAVQPAAAVLAARKRAG